MKGHHYLTCQNPDCASAPCVDRRVKDEKIAKQEIRIRELEKDFRLKLEGLQKELTSLQDAILAGESVRPPRLSLVDRDPDSMVGTAGGAADRN